jgi:hypothetical protein
VGIDPPVRSLAGRLEHRLAERPANLWRRRCGQQSLMQSARGQNQSERYAIHQEAARIGKVAATAHQKGSAKSAINPRAVKVSQNIFRCISTDYLEFRATNSDVPNGNYGKCHLVAPDLTKKRGATESRPALYYRLPQVPVFQCTARGKSAAPVAFDFGPADGTTGGAIGSFSSAFCSTSSSVCT